GFDLWGRDGLRVSSRPSFLRPRTMDLTTITMVMVTFDIPRPGQYTLTISGLDQPSLWDPAYAVVFLRLHIGWMVTSILWIVLLTGIIITSLVFVILRLTGVGLDG
ncbi:MAG TPA: hypothetical protein PLZ95_00995, partial [Bryobacteraceae bacterium]|nr:hypothetical protein [Bryobacteraceae bacterium]